MKFLRVFSLFVLGAASLLAQTPAPAAAKAVSVPTVDASPAFKPIDWKADPVMTEYAKQAGSRAIADWVADFLSKNVPAKRFALMRLASDVDEGYFTSQARNEFSSRALGTDYSLYTREDPEWDRIVDEEMKRGDQTGDMMEKSSIQQWGRQTGVQGVIRGRISGVYVGPAKATNAAGVRLADDAKQLQVRIAMQVFEVETGRLLWGGERVAAVMLPGGEIEVGLTRLQIIKYAAYGLGGLIALFVVFRLVEPLAGPVERGALGPRPMDALDLGATVRAFAPGQKVFNRYTLKRVLGLGSLGAVWLAQDDELNRATALKFLPELVSLDRAAISELKSEVRRVIELAHPHIAKVHDLITDGRTAAISMEFIDGATLAARREAAPGGVLAPAELLPWIRQLGEALDYAHRDAHVIHRDVRPANIMVDGRGRAKLLDFGIGASLMESASRVSRLEVGGPPSYMSPQQLLGEDPTPADDIYSLGATLHELLTGSPPFNAGNIVNHIQKTTAPPVNERRRAAGLEPVPEVWEQLVAVCLAKEATARPGPIAELIKQLESGSMSVPALPAAAIPAALVAPAVAAPAAVPSVPTIPWWKIPAYRWTAVAAVVVAGGLIYWFGDVPGRMEAAQAHELGLKAKGAGNWAQALPALKSAATRRRSEFSYQRDFNEAQEEWLQQLMQQQQALAPADAYTALQGGPAQLAALLEGSTAVNFQKHRDGVQAKLTEQLREKLAAAGQLAAAGKFAEADTVFAGLKAYAALLPELPQARQETQEAEVRHELAEAGASASRGEFAPALERIDAAARRGLLAADISAAREGVREAARLHMVDALAAALLAGDRPASQRALDELATYSNRKFSVTAEQLIGQKSLQDFLRALEELGIRPAAGAPRTSRLDLVLVDRLRGRFTDQAEPARFLGSAYAEWTTELLAAKRPGFALYTAALAREERFPLDAALERQAREQLAADLGFSVVLKPTVITGDNAAGIRDAVRSRLAAVLQMRTGGWLKPVDEAPANSDMALTLGTQLRGLEQSENRQEVAKVVRYQSGTTEESNPNHEQLTSQLEDAESNYERIADSNRSTQRSANQLAGSGNLSALGAILTATASGLSQAEVAKARNRVNELRQQLARTPETVTRAQYANENYREITHDVTYGAALALTIEQSGRTLATGKGWASAYHHRTVEVIGNAARNVPVAAPSYPATAAVAEWLANDLGEKISASTADLLRPLQQATLSLLQRQNSTRRLPAAEADARAWGLIQLWTAVGLAPDITPEIQSRVRAHLGLPAQ